MDVVFLVQIVHVVGVIPDDRDVNDQRALRRHVKAQGADEVDFVEFAGIPAHDERDHEPEDKQNRAYLQVYVPVLLVLLSELHLALLLLSLCGGPEQSAAPGTRPGIPLCRAPVVFPEQYQRPSTAPIAPRCPALSVSDPDVKLTGLSESCWRWVWWAVHHFFWPHVDGEN